MDEEVIQLVAAVMVSEVFLRYPEGRHRQIALARNREGWTFEIAWSRLVGSPLAGNELGPLQEAVSELMLDRIQLTPDEFEQAFQLAEAWYRKSANPDTIDAR